MGVRRATCPARCPSVPLRRLIGHIDPIYVLSHLRPQRDTIPAEGSTRERNTLGGKKVGGEKREIKRRPPPIPTRSAEASPYGPDDTTPRVRSTEKRSVPMVTIGRNAVDPSFDLCIPGREVAACVMPCSGSSTRLHAHSTLPVRGQHKRNLEDHSGPELSA